MLSKSCSGAEQLKDRLGRLPSSYAQVTFTSVCYMPARSIRCRCTAAEQALTP